MKALVSNIKFYLRLYFCLLGFNFQSRLAYRGEFILSLVSVSTELTVRLVFLSVVYSYIPSLAGWTYPQMLLLFASSFILEAIAWFTWRASIFKLHLVVQDGSFDFLMTKPVSLLFITAFRRMDLEDVARVVVGVALLMFSFHLSGIFPSVNQWLLWMVGISLAQVVYFSFSLMLKTTSFWTTQTSEINYVMYSLDRLNQYPTHLYTGFVRFLFTFIIPVTFISTLPAQFLTGTASWLGLLGLAGFAGLIFLLARWVFYTSIKAYSSASS
ncbi:MAG: ABC-2 family transporter protein [Patescibacteria group bacterium]